MVPLVHGQWTEVRTLAVGEVQPPRPTPAGPVSHTTTWSYFSRRTDSTTFAELATLELHRRGIERPAGSGRWWTEQPGASHLSIYIPRAVRILDFAHAAEYHRDRPDGGTGAAHSSSPARLRHALKHDGPDGFCRSARAARRAADWPRWPRMALSGTRAAQLQYPQFVAAGWPIGSGMVESANKLVVEDRLKGAGMHWAEATSIRCWPCAMPCVTTAGIRCGRRWRRHNSGSRRPSAAPAAATARPRQRAGPARRARPNRHRARGPCHRRASSDRRRAILGAAPGVCASSSRRRANRNLQEHLYHAAPDRVGCGARSCKLASIVARWRRIPPANG